MRTEKLVATLDELDKVAELVLRFAENCPVVLFRGDLGAGKTTLIKNICNFLDVKDEVSSPTFSIVNEYQNESGKTIYHFDFYRLKEEEEALDMGAEDYFYSGNLCLIEWRSKIESLLPDQRVEVEISILNETRQFTIKEIS